jgi:hypothetical protein
MLMPRFPTNDILVAFELIVSGLLQNRYTPKF